ncbi:MAG: hypothetical protein K2W96_10390 [Gemmataceae bacterium]|nr:hypothetical protein [Gemmataceae bacterium]
MDAIPGRCPKCGFEYAWDGVACGHCEPATAPRAPNNRWAALFGLAFVILVLCWFCWPGQFSAFNVWMVRPGMSRERVQWLLGSAGEEMETGVGARVFIWRAAPGSWWSGDELVVRFVNGVVYDKRSHEVPLS